MPISNEEALTRYEKEFKMEKDKLILLMEQFYISSFLIEQLEFLPDFEKDIIVKVNSNVSEYKGETFIIFEDYPDDPNERNLDVRKGIKLLKSFFDTNNKFILNHERKLIINHIDCIERIALCEQKIYNLKPDWFLSIAHTSKEYKKIIEDKLKEENEEVYNEYKEWVKKKIEYFGDDVPDWLK